MSAYTLLRYVLDLMIVIPAAVAGMLPVHRFLRQPTRIVYLGAGAVLAFVIVAGSLVCTAANLPPNAILIPMLPLCFLLFAYTIDLSIEKKLFCFASATMLSGFSCVYSVVLMAPIEVTDPGLPFLPATSLTCLLIMSLLDMIFYDVLSHKMPQLLALESRQGVWWLVSAFLLIMTIIMVWVNPTDLDLLLVGNTRMVALVLLPLLPMGMFSLYEISYRMVASLVEGERLKREIDLLLMEEKRYEQLQEYLRETRQLRHDFRQHLLVVEELAKTGNNEQLADYVHQLTGSVGQPHVQLCANPALDALAAHYDGLATAHGCSISWQFDLPIDIPFAEVDLCALMGNLIDNSLMAVQALPEDQRTVQVVMRMLTDEMLGIRVKNAYVGTVRLKDDGLPVSRREGHGIGLTSVAATVERYHGSLDIKTDDGIFLVGILMYARQ